jgi:hypothetical protein
MPPSLEFPHAGSVLCELNLADGMVQSLLLLALIAWSAVKLCLAAILYKLADMLLQLQWCSLFVVATEYYIITGCQTLATMAAVLA